MFNTKRALESLPELYRNRDDRKEILKELKLLEKEERLILGYIYRGEEYEM